MNRIAVTGVTIAGNMGGAAMLAAVCDILGKRAHPPVIDLLSILPGKDRAERSQLHSKVSIVNAHFLLLLLVYLPVSILASPVARLQSCRALLSKIPYFRSLLNACAVVDLSGIAFVDGRGLPLLAYNVACSLPASMLGVPVVKVAQALGPFEKMLNRFSARQVLGRCDLVIARGDITSRYLQKLGVAHAVHSDIAFAMNVSDQDRELARKRLAASHDLNKRLVIVSPSEVARRLANKAGIDFIAEFVQLILSLERKGFEVVLLPHSYGEGRSKNNDVDLARKIHASTPDANTILISDIRDPRQLRAIIGMADLFIGCRFHSVVAALSTAVPTVTIGWSHKYAEMAAAFDADKFVVPVEQFSASTVLAVITRLETEYDSIGEKLLEVSKRAKVDAEKNLDRVQEILDMRGQGAC